ncbi:MerR family DNA-binding transcriptional regulator [Desulfosediminicola sp.]
MRYETVGIGEVAKQCNVTEKQLRYWQEAGYINPETVKEPGSDSDRFSG